MTNATFVHSDGTIRKNRRFQNVKITVHMLASLSHLIACFKRTFHGNWSSKRQKQKKYQNSQNLSILSHEDCWDQEPTQYKKSGDAEETVSSHSTWPVRGEKWINIGCSEKSWSSQFKLSMRLNLKRYVHVLTDTLLRFRRPHDMQEPTRILTLVFHQDNLPFGRNYHLLSGDGKIFLECVG